MPDGVTVQGPDGKTYQFPSGTTKDSAISYFKKKGIGAPAIPDATKQAQAAVRKASGIDQATDSTFVPTHPYGGGGISVTGKPEEVEEVRGAKRNVAVTGAASAATAGMAEVPGILGLIARGLASGGAAGGMHALSKTSETGSPDLSGAARTGAGFAAAEMGGEAVAKGAGAVISKLRPKTDPTIKINDLLGVSRKEIKVGSTPESLSDFAQNPGRGVIKSGLDEKVLGKMNPLERNIAITKARNDVGKQLDDVFTKASGGDKEISSGKLIPESVGGGAAKKVDFQKVMDSVFDEGVIPDKNLAKQTADRLQQILDKTKLRGKLLSELTPKEAWTLRQELDEFASFSSVETAKTFREVATKLRRGLSDALHKAVPESTVLDQQYTDLVGATKAARRQATDFAKTTPESKLRSWIIKAAVKAGKSALPIP